MVPRLQNFSAVRGARIGAARPGMLLPALILVLVCLAAQGCLLFTAPVNSPPTVTVMVLAPTNPSDPGAGVTLMAKASDPDGGPIRLLWSTTPGDCSQPPDPAAMKTESPAGNPTFDFRFAPGGPDTVCVRVTAIDPQGASGSDALPLSKSNRPPQAVITVLEPSTTASNGEFPLFSTFHLSAAASSDPDEDTVVDPQWAVTSMPNGATPTFARCPSPTPTDFLQCLDVRGAAGLYTVSLSVGDGHMGSGSASKMLMVAYDHPPCVSTTEPRLDASPIIDDPMQDQTLQITGILDDGSPLPAPVEGTHTLPTFTWQVRRNGGAAQTIVGYENVNALKLPGSTYASGDVVEVTATISDGVAMHLEPACDPACPAGCPQQARWTVEYR